MSAKGITPSYRKQRRPKSGRKPGFHTKRSSKLLHRSTEDEILALVRTGVEEFVLERATVEDFFEMMRALAEKENIYSHPLTSAAFSKIVKEAIRKRKGQSKRT